MMASEFSCASKVRSFSAPCSVAKFIPTGNAPNAVKVLIQSGLTGTRSRRPSRS